MKVRTFQRGDETAQAAIYNEAAAALPKFKPATSHEVARRVSARDFDPASRFYALEDGEPVAYAAYNANGRVSYPWCRKGHESLAAPLFDHMLLAMRQRGLPAAFAAYRADWPPILEFFQQHGFAAKREMVNFIIGMVDMPTASARRSNNITPLERGDVPALFALAPHVVRSASAADLERHLFDNPYFEPTAVFVLRRRDRSPMGAGILIQQPNYADPKVLDASMPCFRLGAFGAEGMEAKRIKGLFSFLCTDDGHCGGTAVDLMSHAANLLQNVEEIGTLAAQVPSDAQHWLRFYQMNFKRQGSFPVLERALLPA